MVSVIVPVYKVEQYLPRCIDSILKQSYTDIEIILVDDGSPDSCGAICDEYAKKDARIQVVHKENGGLSSARNAGMKVAQGDYISFIDSDDWVDENFIKTLVEVMVKEDADMSACTFCRTKGDAVERSQFNQEVEAIVKEKYFCIFSERFYAGYAWNKLYKREIIQEHGLLFDETIFNGEDFPFTLEYVHYANKVAFTRQDLYFYFFRETGIMQSIRLSARFATILWAREKALAFLAQHAPDCYDICKASYLSILAKIKMMAMLEPEKHKELYNEANEKIKKQRKGLFSLKRVGKKEKLKLFLMIYFPRISARMYRKKVKVGNP